MPKQRKLFNSQTMQTLHKGYALDDKIPFGAHTKRTIRWAAENNPGLLEYLKIPLQPEVTQYIKQFQLLAQ